tara:strand:+ start:411 stop:707 length:297 start_codon:yes stop_codon:yes gene_type:complete
MRTNLTKKEIVNSIYMQLGLSKRIIDLILEDILNIILINLKDKGKVKLTNFGTFEIRYKKERVGRNPKTKEKKKITARNVVLFKPSKDFKKFVNKNEH